MRTGSMRKIISLSLAALLCITALVLNAVLTVGSSDPETTLTIGSSGFTGGSGGNYNTTTGGNWGRSSGGSSGGSSGRNRADRYSNTLSVINGISNNVASDGSVDQSVLRTELESAVRTANSGTVTLRTRNARSIDSSTLRMLSNATTSSRNILLYADTLSDDFQAVQGRLYVEPAKLAGVNRSLQLGVYTDNAHTSVVRNKFAPATSGSVAVVSFGQQTSFGTRLQVAARVNLSNMNRDNLYFYSYNRTTNQYGAIADPQYSFDSTGYLHFYVEEGGDVVIADAPLRFN